MKKVFSIVLSALLLIGLSGCFSNNNDNSMSELGYKVGMASYTTTGKSSGAVDDKNGKSVVSTTYVTAVFDKAGVIKKVYIDKVEAKMYFDAKGQLAESSQSEVLSKRDLGDAYNMKSASPIGKEWYEQIDALEKYLEGKNVMDFIGNATYGPSEGGTVSSMYDNSATIDGGVLGDGGDVSNLDTNSRLNDNSSSMANSSSLANSSSMANSSVSSPASGSSSVNSGSALNWQEDLKASVTIDLSNIQRALKKAYDNAR